MKEVKTKQYSIYIGTHFFPQLRQLISEYQSVFILVDENTKRNCLKAIKPAVNRELQIIQIKSGEKNKTLRTCEKIWRELSRQNADRKSLLINLGGGVICDIGGFCASTYKRGIDFINIPTTLLSQADASVGGKTGIDFVSYKNLIGTFSFPKAVFVNPDFMKTLPKRELISGFAEIIKHALIADKEYWKTISSQTPWERKEWSNIIFHSIEIKNKIVSTDPYENGPRKVLNFGHTIGHAIETALLKTRKPLLHGEAIAIGMICELYLSRKVLGLQMEEMGEIIAFIIRVFKPKPITQSIKQLINLMKQDKKNMGLDSQSGIKNYDSINEDLKINFTLISSIGKAKIDTFCTYKLIEESITYFNTQCI